VNKCDDSFLKRLSRMDPAQVDSEPTKGSDRYHSILEAAMHTVQDPNLTAAADRPAARPHWKRRLVFAAAAAVVVGAVAVGIVLLQPGRSVSPAAAVAAAATNLGEMTTLRGAMVREASLLGEGDELVDSTSSTIEVDGVNVRVESTTTTGEEAPFSTSFTVIGDQMWETSYDGTTTSSTLSPNPDERLAPFAQASEAVLKAALTDASVVKMGSESVRDRQAIHYHIGPADSWQGALTRLSPSVLAWFELEAIYPETAVDVWVSDGMIVRIVVEDNQVTATLEFYDFGADIHIEPPAGS
jgi:hypothetical protein